MFTTRLDPDILPRLLARFYQRVRQDRELGPVFDAIVEDWDEHLLRLEDFWSSLMLASGRYKGNPLAMHAIHAARFSDAMFERWLVLWEQTTSEMLPPEPAAIMQIKAHRIAERLKTAIHHAQNGDTPNRANPLPVILSTGQRAAPGPHGSAVAIPSLPSG